MRRWLVGLGIDSKEYYTIIERAARHWGRVTIDHIIWLLSQARCTYVCIHEMHDYNHDIHAKAEDLGTCKERESLVLLGCRQSRQASRGSSVYMASRPR